MKRLLFRAAAVLAGIGMLLLQQHGILSAAPREKLQWVRQAPGAGYSSATAVATDKSGDIYLAGIEKPAGGSVTASLQNVFISRFDADGKEIWTARLVTGGSDSVQGIAADTAGHVYITGFTTGSFEGTANAGDTDIFVAKLDSRGSVLWVRLFGTQTRDCANAITSDRNGNIYIAGYTWGSFDHSKNSGGSDFLVIKLNTSGEKLWSRQTGTPSLDVATGITADSWGFVHVAGYTLGSFGGFRNAGGSDIVLVTYNPEGEETGLIQDGSVGNDFANGIVTDRSGNRYITGHTWGQLGERANAGLADFFISRYSSDGERTWTRQEGSNAWDEATAIAVDEAGNLVITGHTYGALEGNTSAGNDDIFAAKYQPDGTRLDLFQFGTPQLDYAKAVAADGDGSILLAGHTKGSLDNTSISTDYAYFLMKLAPEISLHLMAPGTESLWTTGNVETIRWEYSGNPGKYVSLALHRNGNLIRTVGVAAVTDRQFRWKVPEDVMQADDYTVTIQPLGNLRLTVTSSSFSIRRSSGFSVDTPGKGAKVLQGEVVDITWSASGDTGAYAFLSLNKKGVFQKGIGAAKSADRLFKWPVPGDIPAGIDYSIQIRSLANPAARGTGSAFEIRTVNLQPAAKKYFTAPAADILDTSSGWRR